MEKKLNHMRLVVGLGQQMNGGWVNEAIDKKKPAPNLKKRSKKILIQILTNLIFFKKITVDCIEPIQA